MFISVTKCVTERDEVTKTTKFDKFIDKFMINSWINLWIIYVRKKNCR